MQNLEHTSKRVVLLDNDMKRVEGHLAALQHILLQKETASRLADFDENAEQDIAEIFGSSSELREAYAYAKLGEAAGWMNLPEEAQESGAQDFNEISHKQRVRVLERCIATLKTQRSILMDLTKS